MSKVTDLKNNIKGGIKEISNNKLKDIEDIESLRRWCAWIYTDGRKLIKEWRKK